MRPVLVLALGNALAGDDAVAHRVAATARADGVVAERADIITAGTDLFRYAAEIAGRDRVIIVDAALTDSPGGSVHVLPHAPPDSDRRVHAHALDPVAAFNLLRALRPDVATVDVWWLLIDVPEIAIRPGLSEAAARLVPAAAARLRQLVLERRAPGRRGG